MSKEREGRRVRERERERLPWRRRREANELWVVLFASQRQTGLSSVT